MAAELHHVGAVEPGRVDADEHLAVAGLGVGVLLDAELVIADRDGAHGPGPTRATSWATHSMCGVCGNMSTGRTRSRR